MSDDRAAGLTHTAIASPVVDGRPVTIGVVAAQPATTEPAPDATQVTPPPHAATAGLPPVAVVVQGERITEADARRSRAPVAEVIDVPAPHPDSRQVASSSADGSDAVVS